VQGFVDAVQFLVYLDRTTCMPLRLGDSGKFNQPRDEPPQAAKEPAHQRAAAPGSGLLLGTDRALTAKQCAAQELQLALLVFELLEGRLGFR
jgi:hypothetical protein